MAALRAVKPGERRPRRGRPKTVAGAARSGDRRELLEALRDRISRTIDDPNCPARDLAALSRRLQELDKELAALTEAEAEEAREHGAAEDEAWDAEAL